MSRDWITRGLAAAAACATLAGCVPTVAALGTVTATGVVQERTTRDALTDIEIETTINNSLLNHSGELFRRVGVEVVEGRVLLSGAVSRTADSVKASEIAWSAQGVREVANELTINGDPSLGRYSEDLWITAQLRGRLIAEEGIDSVNYTIETHRGVVYLTGLAESPRELERVTRMAASIKGVQKVVSHVLSIDDPRRAANPVI